MAEVRSGVVLFRFACRLARVLPMVLVTSCDAPEATPVPAGDVAPAGAERPKASGEAVRTQPPAVANAQSPEIAQPEQPTPTEPASPDTAAATANPWGAPLRTTGKRHGLVWTTTAQIERTATTLQLAFEVELHNSTRAPMPVSVHQPLVTIMTAPAPGSDGEGIGLGMRGEGMGSDVCSPGHGGPTTLPADGRAFVKRTVELEPLPWPAQQAYRVTASTRDCRPGRLSLDVLDVTVVQPASPDGVPTLLAASPDVDQD